MTTAHDTRAKVLRLLQSGRFTLSEAAALAGVSRQLVRHWTLTAKVDAKTARRNYLRKLYGEK